MPNRFSRASNHKFLIRSQGSAVTNDQSRATCFSYLASILVSSFFFAMPFCHAQQTKRPFTVADDVGLTLFRPLSGGPPELHFSPDGNYFSVWSERGRLGLNQVEDSLRFYRSRDAENVLGRSDSDRSQPPSPVWIVSRSDKEGPVINDLRWLANSSGVAFLERAVGGNQHVVLADLQSKTVEPLTSESENVQAFDVRDRQHYVFTASDPVERKRLLEKTQAERQSPAIVGTARPVSQLLFPSDSGIAAWLSPRSYLYAVVGDRSFQVKQDGVPIVPEGSLALSPDGQSLVTTLTVPEVPPSWETLYPPPNASSPYRISAGRDSAHQYVRINLRRGSVQALTDAPISNGAGWASVLGGPSWSSDGQAIVLPGTFLKSKENAPSRPCVAVVDLRSNTNSCVEMLKGRTETGDRPKGYHIVSDARFAGGDKLRVTVSYYSPPDISLRTTEYELAPDGTWQVAGQSEGMLEVRRDGLEVTVKEGFNNPPLLVAKNRQVSRIIWDPNPQLKNVELGDASVFTWKDKTGRDWKGGLFKPSNYKQGQRYPLVIQTHGFTESEFRPSGLFPTAFAARALAAAGMVVLQAVDDDGCPVGTIDEGQCAVSDYEAAANQLVSQGLVDPEKIGIIGFSRTCFYVMEMLTTSSFRFKAASVTDGVMGNYWQYILQPERIPTEANMMIGVPPFGEGLQQWLKRSPGFNLDKVTAPLLVVGEGPYSLLFMWEAYAGLHYLRKPVELVMLKTDEHVLTNPAVRMASQGGSVDWFRFWLKDEEDSELTKAEQYARWRELRKMQAENDAKQKAAATKN